MSNEKLNQSFAIPLQKIEEEIGTHFNNSLVGYSTVVSPRALEFVDTMILMRTEILEKLVRKIPLRSEEKEFPYKDSEISVFSREPKGFEVGQTFISSQKILSIMDNLEGRIFSGFELKGISKMPPVQIYGLDKQGKKVIAFYIPPIIEIHGNQAVLIDGVHRSYICKSAGTTINAIHVNNVSAPLPFKAIKWQNTSVVTEKPPIEQRYLDLKKEYFRDLGAVGIDG